MAKRLKLRIFRVITTTLQSCRSKDPSNLPSNPVPSFNPKSNEQDQFKWQKEENWHVIAKIHHEPRRKIYNSSASEDENNYHTRHAFAEKKKKKHDKNHKISKKKKFPTYKTRNRISTTSSCDSEAEEETETLVSSSLSCLSSTDHSNSSSEFNNNMSHSTKLRPIKESKPFTTNRKHAHKRRTKRAILRQTGPTSFATTEEADQVPARLSVFQKLIPCTVDGKVKESFAIVKRSKDPYEDFKSSMMDMILEKQMFEPEDLEQLLQCFLSLNSRCYHGVIVEAFAEIWEAIFCTSTTAESRSCVHHQQLIVN